MYVHLIPPLKGAVLSSKAQTDRDLERIREEARKIVHALHKAQDRMDDLEVSEGEDKHFLLEQAQLLYGMIAGVSI